MPTAWCQTFHCGLHRALPLPHSTPAENIISLGPMPGPTLVHRNPFPCSQYEMDVCPETVSCRPYSPPRPQTPAPSGGERRGVVHMIGHQNSRIALSASGSDTTFALSTMSPPSFPQSHSGGPCEISELSPLGALAHVPTMCGRIPDSPAILSSRPRTTFRLQPHRVDNHPPHRFFMRHTRCRLAACITPIDRAVRDTCPCLMISNNPRATFLCDSGRYCQPGRNRITTASGSN